MGFEVFAQPAAWASLLTLTALEIVLGIDNIIFISILSGRLPPDQAKLARRIGLGLALLMRVGLLFALSWIMGLTAPLFSVLGFAISGRTLILFGGGVFLIAKATTEIYHQLEVEDTYKTGQVLAAGALVPIVIQIVLLDLVFSLDSVLTAIGMSDQLLIMVLAVAIAIGVMLLSAASISDFIHRHPSMKMLALAFLLLIGVMLTAEATGYHVPKGYIYSAVAFSLLVEVLNLRVRRKQRGPVTLHAPAAEALVERREPPEQDRAA